MNQKLKEKTHEALSSVIPITVIVFILSVVIVPMSIGTITMFLGGAALLIVGMGLFTLGAELSMIPMGEGIGSAFAKTKKLWFVAGACFLVGFIVTIAEPDLQVLAEQVPDIPSDVLIATVAIGVGIFLVTAVLRILFKIRLSYILVFLYVVVFAISFITPKDFIAVAFDSGGVTTGPMTVPFILAIGIGLTSIRGSKSSGDDSFGFVALSSIGPIIAVLLLGICFNPHETTYTQVTIPVVETTRDVVRLFAVELPGYFKKVSLALAPVCLFFIVFQLIYRRFKKLQLIKMAVGIVYVLVGLALFLTGVHVGFIPAGSLIGTELAASNLKWLLVPVGMLMGYFIVAAEPAVHVLNREVEEVSCGAIPQSAMNICMSIGVSASVGLSMFRVLTGISIYWFLIPGYALAISLTFFVPKIFIGIAFDSGGVASGPMTTTFLLPFAMGACEAIPNGNVLLDAFGIVAMVAMTPLIVIQLMGLLYRSKINQADAVDVGADVEEIIEYEEASLDE